MIACSLLSEDSMYIVLILVCCDAEPLSYLYFLSFWENTLTTGNVKKEKDEFLAHNFIKAEKP